MLLKLKAGHCDYAVEELEYIIGGRRSVAKWPDEADLTAMRPVWARGPKVHFLTGKSVPRAQALLAEIDQGIADAEKSGEAAALRKKYFDATAPAAGSAPGK
jgi:ABC-type amino acid transport substrate-binding protein